MKHRIRPAVVMMFRDEADIIIKSLDHWRSLGVRDFYLCDNGSLDNSMGIARFFMDRYDLSGLSFIDIATDWPGRRVVNRLKELAISGGCNFIFPADADEFLELPENMQLSEWIETIGACEGWGELPYLNILPDGKRNWQEPHRKVFGFITKDMTISMGNHLIEGSAPTLKAHGAYYRHYSIRSYPQFKKKMENYMTAFSQTQFKDHPHAVDFNAWQEQGEQFFVNRWQELTGLNVPQ